MPSRTARSLALFLIGLAAAALPLEVTAVIVSPDEMTEAGRWSRALFQGLAPAPPEVGLEVVSNYDLMQKNSRFGKPLRLAGASLSRGLFCHAPSHITVRLPGPARRFEALVGVDSNEQTSGGRGSVVFKVTVGDKSAFESAVLHEGMPAVPVRGSLDGATRFDIAVTDGGDGITCDQADWANAFVVLQDGRKLYLDEMPTGGGPVLLPPNTAPFSFVYGGKPSGRLLPTWECKRASRQVDAARVEHTVTYRDPETSLEVRMVGIEYRDYPTIEWTLHLRNNGAAPSPILEQVMPLDMRFARGHYGEYLLHHAVGSPCAPNDYAPLETPLTPGLFKQVGASGGRPTNSDMSYFSLETPTGHGAIVVVGWPGQWASKWERDADTGLRVTAGQELTHFSLNPGEEVRTPLIVLQSWTGDWIHGQNVWRRWMLDHNVPRPNGKLPQPELFGCSSHLFSEMEQANEENQKDCIDRYLAAGVPISHWWMDAGWYPNKPVGWPKTGTWEVDKTRFPNGLRAISDHAHSKGVKTILWFEPERVHPDTWITQNHPEWVHGGKAGGLLDLGNPEVRTWLTDHVDKLMTDEGIDLYRQDFNMDPLDYWRGADRPDRQGITEIRHVEGYLAYWDELLRRHPGMFIDSCASGGRRNDLETMRRAIPLWRTDWRCEPIGTQGCQYGISLWIPLSGTGAADVDPYLFHSNMAPFTNCLFDIRSASLDKALLHKLVGQWQRVADCYLGDFYPLTSHNLAKDGWVAWQYHLIDKGKGMVQAFRREKCIFETGRLKLGGLEPGARYEVTDLDTNQSRVYTGKLLSDRGLPVTITGNPGSAIYAYRRIGK